MNNAPPLTGPGDPPLFKALNEGAERPLLLICDHASRAIPRSMDSLGLPEEVLERHIAYDIGAAQVTELLAHRLGVPALLAGYSRLLIDANRAPGDPMSVLEVSDGVSIPGNQDLSEADLTRREETFFEPYHNAVTNALAQLWRLGRAPALLSIHSFTPSLNGEDRQWDIGVLWNRDPRIALPLIEKLSAHEGLHVGDNEPYSGREIAYSLDLHGGAAGLANCAVEIRQDHLETPGGAARWAELLGDAFEEILAIDYLYKVEHF
ncbi:MAG TPA: N-formylglutamate amidohydrolase [Rhodospirillales bacterium]|nr:N-formylglutamate amidohydrolase [Rhodospirillales bacterium]